MIAAGEVQQQVQGPGTVNSRSWGQVLAGVLYMAGLQVSLGGQSMQRRARTALGRAALWPFCPRWSNTKRRRSGMVQTQVHDATVS